MSTAYPFAGLAPDTRAVRGRGDLVAFDLEAAIALGQDLRRTCEGAHDLRAVATALVDAVNGFEHERRPACALVRAFVGDGAKLRLVATRGLDPAWNDETRSESHRELTLASGDPMVAELDRQLRIGDDGQAPTGTFHVADAVASAAVPAKSFVRSYDVRSVFGFLVRIAPGAVLVVLAFSRAPIERNVVRAFETVARYARLALLRTEEARNALGPAYTSRCADAMEQLLELHEITFRESLSEERRTRDVSTREAKRAAEAAAAEVERHNAELRRTQRAMLNLVEDLREAREALAMKVELRTREVADANRALEARNKELEEFVYIASHDLQEPLRTVAGYLQMIERRYGAKLGPEGDEFITFAIQGAERMQLLMESLLSYSRVATAERQLEPISLDEALDVALRNLAIRIEETGARIERAPLPVVRADRLQMVQLFQNLVGNAIKFAGAGTPRVHVTSMHEDDALRVDVRDEGIGFDPKFADRIFKVFRRLRRDTPGTGIGLAICKKIVERHGGSIVATGAPGAGATFSVRLPLTTPLLETPS